MSHDPPLDPETRVVHAGEHDGRIEGAVAWPIFQSTVFDIEAAGGYDDLRYIRYGNLPNQRLLGTKLADLEGAQAALVTASGMAAISSTLLTVLESGDHLLAGDGLYGGTQALIARRLPRLGIEHDVLPGEDPASWDGLVRPETKAVYVETITNPLLRVPPLDEVAAFAGRHGLLAIVDNTFATPLAFRPAEHGFDLSVHSCTKYLNGHSDLVAGAVIGRRDLVAAVEKSLHLFGGALDPHAAFLLTRGLKTLALRVERQSRNALVLARHLDGHPAVAKVSYPGLPEHPDHARASELLDGYGGMLAVEPKGGVAAADHLLASTHIATHSASLGGVETLVVSPARSSHAALTPEERAAVGISDALVRVSVGIEAVDDLIADFDRALAG